MVIKAQERLVLKEIFPVYLYILVICIEFGKKKAMITAMNRINKTNGLFSSSFIVRFFELSDRFNRPLNIPIASNQVSARKNIHVKCTNRKVKNQPAITGILNPEVFKKR
jgi:hypothetical protein